MSSASRSGCSARISSVDIPSATIATTVATGNRRSRIHGTPAIRPGSVVIRTNAMEKRYHWDPTCRLPDRLLMRTVGRRRPPPRTTGAVPPLGSDSALRITPPSNQPTRFRKRGWVQLPLGETSTHALGSDESGHEREQSERHATDYEFAIDSRTPCGLVRLHVNLMTVWGFLSRLGGLDDLPPSASATCAPVSET